MNEDFNIVIHKVRAFRNKYFLYKMVRGFLFLLLISVVVYLILSFSENRFYFSAQIRKILFHSTFLFLSIMAVIYVLIPLLKLTVIFKKDEKSRISKLVGSYFPEIKDKLINIIELNSLKDDGYSISIINAAVSQKSKELSIFNFTEAINLKNLRNILLYFVLSLAVTLLIYSFDKSLIIEPGKRIIHYNQEFEKPAPYIFVLPNENMKVKKGESFKLEVKCEGNEVPSLLYVNIQGNNFLMKRTENNAFEYDIPSVTNSVNLQFTDLKYKSAVYLLKVIPVPVINNYETEVIFPSYTLLKSEIRINNGDLKIPKGSVVKWNFECYDTDSLIIQLKSGSQIKAKNENDKTKSAQYQFKETDVYEILVKNKETEYEAVMKFYVEIIEDLYPEIELVQLQDSIVVTRFLFKGRIRDDYGFTKLNFNIIEENRDTVLDIGIARGLNQQDFYYSIDFKEFNLSSKQIKYYFSVTDNDRINLPKTTLTETFYFSFPSEKELDIKKQEDFKNLEKLISESKNITKQIKEDLKDLQFKSINNSITDWEKSQMVNDILSEKSKLDEILNRIEQLNKQSNNFQNTFNEQSDQIAEKQKEIEKLMDDVMTDELKKLLDEFKKLADEFNEKKFNELNPKMDLSLEDLTKQLDRNLEMLKKFKIEQQIENLISKIEKIQKNEEINSEEILKSGNFDESLKNIEDDIIQSEEIKSEISDIQRQNEELKKPMIFDGFESEQEEIKKEMGNSKESLQKKNRKESSESMKRTAQMLENLSFSIKQLLKANSAENKGENILTIKRILKNLLYISVNQEDVLNGISGLSDMDPSLRDSKRKQKILSEQFIVVKDSLYALANRAPQAGNIVNEELVAMNINLNESVQKLDESNLPQASINQRMVITAANNMILFLSEILQQMEEQEMNESDSDENCNNEGKGKMGGLKKSGGSIKDQIQQMIDQMKNGQGKNMSREMSEALMQHELMQKMLRDLMNNGGLSNDAKKQLQQVDQLLEQNRREIMNKNINPSMITRHNQILSKLLEAENSENERDLDNKRESETADDQFYSNPAKFFEGNENKNNTIENLDRKTFKLTNFYRDKQRVYQENRVKNDFK